MILSKLNSQYFNKRENIDNSVRRIHMQKVLRFCQKAIVEKNGKILIMKTSEVDPSPFMWEVPGGGINWGEDLKDGFNRELKEEVGPDFEVECGDPVYISSWIHPYHRVLAHAVWVFLPCKYKKGTVKLSEEHCEYAWINPQDYKNYPMLDMVKNAIQKYIKLKKEKGI